MVRRLLALLLLAYVIASCRARLFKYNVEGDTWSSSEEERKDTDEVWFEQMKMGSPDSPNSNSASKVWAVLVAGSRGYYNYRHQADICHAYHVLRNHGIKEEHIITMMYDDIANNKLNPYPGKIFNSPAMKDVYAGVRIDYRHDDVNPKNFMAILTGNRSAVHGGNGRVLESKGDKVFIYFADHGGVGMLSFPKGVLTVKQLSNTIKQMHEQEMFTEMTIYIEACESGSMFENVLPSTIKVYAVTAANSRESSYGCYCDAVMNLPCLGDLFSVNWLQDSDKENLNNESLAVQYKNVKQRTDMSHVCRFGDHSIWREHVAEFQGDGPGPANVSPPPNPSEYQTWSSRDIPIMEMIRQRDMEADEAERRRLSSKIHLMQKKRLYLDEQIVALVGRIVHDQNNRNRVLYTYPKALARYLDCHHHVVNSFHRSCFDFNKNPYALKHAYVLENLCELGINEQLLSSHFISHCELLGNTESLRIV